MIGFSAITQKGALEAFVSVILSAQQTVSQARLNLCLSGDAESHYGITFTPQDIKIHF